MEGYKTQTELVAAKLRSLEHYCPEAAKEQGMQRLADILANEIEKHDNLISAEEFKSKLEIALKQYDPQDYASESEGDLIPIIRLFFLDIITDSVLPKCFAEQVKGAYK